MEDDKGITSELITDILNNIKLLLGINDSKKDSLLILYIKAVCTNILIKTNRRKFIPELKYVVMDLVMDKYDSFIDDTELGSIKSMSEYDRTVTFGIEEHLKYKLDLIAKKQLDENEQLIKRYKLLYRT